MLQQKKMNVVQLTTITAINMMGSGIIMLPANLVQVGTMSILPLVVTLAGAIFLAWGFAQAGMFTRKRGGMGGYSEYSFGKAGGFLSSYTYGLSLVIANVAIAISAVGYFAQIFHWTLSPLMVCIATIICLWLASVLNFGGASITGKLSSVTVWGVIIPLFAVILLGWFWFDPHLYATAWNHIT